MKNFLTNKIIFLKYQWNRFFKCSFFQDILTRRFIAANIVLNIVLWALLLLVARPTSNLLPFKYTITSGVVSLTPWYYLYLFALAGLLIFLLNFIISRMIYYRERIVALIVLAASIFIQCLILIYEILLILIIKG